jgi:hypothetical protein
MISWVGFENNGSLVVTPNVAQLPAKCSTWMEGGKITNNLSLTKKKRCILTLHNHGGLQNTHAWRI